MLRHSSVNACAKTSLAKWEAIVHKHYMQCGCMMKIDESTAAGIGSNVVSH